MASGVKLNVTKTSLNEAGTKGKSKLRATEILGNELSEKYAKAAVKKAKELYQHAEYDGSVDDITVDAVKIHTGNWKIEAKGKRLLVVLKIVDVHLLVSPSITIL